MVEQHDKRQSETLKNQSRRKLVKRLALIAATGYLAPKAVMISKPWACHRGGPDSKPREGQSLCFR